MSSVLRKLSPKLLSVHLMFFLSFHLSAVTVYQHPLYFYPSEMELLEKSAFASCTGHNGPIQPDFCAFGWRGPLRETKLHPLIVQLARQLILSPFWLLGQTDELKLTQAADKHST